jgi:uncharacterized protein
VQRLMSSTACVWPPVALGRAGVAASASSNHRARIRSPRSAAFRWRARELARFGFMSNLTLLALILVAAGGLSGFLAGVFGVGGGTVVVPILYEVFVMLGVPNELRMPLCAGTSLALIIPTSIASFTSHRKTDAVNFDLLRLWSVPIIAGVIGGTVLARYAPAAVFKIVFVLIALLTAVRLIFRERLPTLGQDVPRRLRLPYGLTIGLSASLIGIGGGILSNMIMTFHGRPIHESVATSAGVGVMVSIPGALGYIVAGWDRMGLPPLSLGFVSIAAVLVLMPTGFFAARLGARIAHHVSGRRLELCFATYLIIICGEFGSSLALD